MEDYIGIITLPGGITTNPDVLIKALYLLALGVSGLVFFAMLIMGGFRFLTAVEMRRPLLMPKKL